MKILFFTYTFENVGFDPLNIMSLSAVLKLHGHETSFVMQPRKTETVRRQLRDFRPDILAYSSTTGMHRYFLDLNRSIRKEYDAFTIFGGPHATFFPEMLEQPGVDAIGVGECDFALSDLADALGSGGRIDNIPNIHVKMPGGEIVRNAPRPLVENLDDLPMPDRDLLYSKRKGESHGFVNFMAGRGCIFKCTYCFNHAFDKLYERKNPSVRFRSVQNLIEEAKYSLSLYKAQFVYFADDCFIFNREWLREFAETWPKEIGLPFSCAGRYNLHTEENMALLKQAGCQTVYAAVEVGNDKLRNDLLNRKMSREQILNGAELVHKYNMNLLTQSIIALPHSTLATDLETLDLVAKCRPQTASSAVFLPMPRTELGEIAVKEGFFDGNPDNIPNDAMASKACIKLPDAKYQTRLHSIFSIAAEFRFVRALLPLLLRLPIEKPGFFMNRIWKGYCARYRLYRKLDYSPLRTIKYALRYLLRQGD